jgi:hypothetical protein
MFRLTLVGSLLSSVGMGTALPRLDHSRLDAFATVWRVFLRSLISFYMYPSLYSFHLSQIARPLQVDFVCCPLRLYFEQRGFSVSLHLKTGYPTIFRDVGRLEFRSLNKPRAHTIRNSDCMRRQGTSPKLRHERLYAWFKTNTGVLCISHYTHTSVVLNEFT